jgi:hypothetical protein
MHLTRRTHKRRHWSSTLLHQYACAGSRSEAEVEAAASRRALFCACQPGARGCLEENVRTGQGCLFGEAVRDGRCACNENTWSLYT